jgi:hypothetical protein
MRKDMKKQNVRKIKYIIFKTRLFCIALNLHYLYENMKVGGVSAIKINEFILYCAQLALPLPAKIYIVNDV